MLGFLEIRKWEHNNNVKYYHIKMVLQVWKTLKDLYPDVVYYRALSHFLCDFIFQWMDDME